MRKPRWAELGSPKLPLLAILGALVCALALAACGGGGSSSSTESPAPSGEEATTAGGGGEQAEGDPIVTWTYTDVNTEGNSVKNLSETVRVYQEWVNAHGGIDGRPLEAHFCDSRGTPTAAAACAREAVAGNAVAVVSNFSFTGDAVIPILEQGKTAQFGNCCQVSPSELTSPVSLGIGNGPLFGTGMVVAAVKEGCKKIVGVLNEGDEAFEPLMEAAAKAEGTSIQRFVTLPATPGDLSPQVAEATRDGTDCLLIITPEANQIAWMAPFAQSGSKARMFGLQGSLTEKAVEGFEEAAEGAVAVGTFPNLSLPQWANFREALKEYEADSSEDYNSLAGLGTWAAFEAFKQVVESMKGEINNEAFLKAADSAKVNLPGMVPPEDFAKPWIKDGGPEGFDRIFNRCIVYSEIKAGKLVPGPDEFEDVSEASGGSKPMNCGPPFG
ncbi:MAG: ABC transporter substrate-binding protein [Solirubrobacterales bacterium]